MRRCRCHAHNALRPQPPPETAELGARAAAECGPFAGDTTPVTPVTTTTAAGAVAGAVEPSAQGGRPIGGALAPSSAPLAAAARREAAAPPPACPPVAATEVEVMGSEEARRRGFRPDEEVLMPLPVWSDSDEE